MTPLEFVNHCPELVDVYWTAMDLDARGLGGHSRQSRVRHWRSLVHNPGFRAICAVTNGRITGIAYGMDGELRRNWTRAIADGLARSGGSDPRWPEILADYYEISELHVLPEAQGQGTGRKLLTELLDGVPQRWALLSTPEVPNEANRAFSLYRALGFTDVVRYFTFFSDPRLFAVLAAELPLEDRRISRQNGH
ncbi:GNAT family N-acetyltransferase [Corynebacterium sp. CCM 9185]|uniref:GNAT family N-acetyltransferase n=1 Tax=Corynebacterium marambiense TaxID=2765364 RepID=A0ABS0VVQ3_9CORY|nr:GNAT family N-acetyltransferase [Corynebacterium marambiense]MBI9000871.1 GNAT family N-acetyltransferase [Corynebacterium marambiense]MCK7662861.1 GNAT family N-acetyltransferase [Corynebacterium marambiense]MCX7542470.1 GNAT family N-acetyltransferase [Corynebacterium marambiense]